MIILEPVRGWQNKEWPGFAVKKARA